jgi:hypothetical protein
MYASGYNKLFWGMMFIIFHINLGPISVLPSFIGYMVIYSGLNILSSQHKVYEKGKIPSIVLIVLTFKDVWHNENNNIITGQFTNLGLTTLIITTMGTLINLYLIYIICKGIYELCKQRGLNEFMDSTIATWKFYLVVVLIALFYIPFSINLPLDYNIFMIIVAVVQMIASISIAVLFRKCKLVLET